MGGVDNVIASDSVFLGEDWEGAGVCLTDADLMHAAEVLMSPNPLDEKRSEETDNPCL